jgi:hypothetical protein
MDNFPHHRMAARKKGSGYSVYGIRGVYGIKIMQADYINR